MGEVERALTGPVSDGGPVGRASLCPSKVGRPLGFNAQSSISVTAVRNTIHLITSQSLLTVPDISQSLFGEVLENMK